jgi:hypothetical protein
MEHGAMEYWSDGVMYEVSLLITPILHDPITPEE